METGLNPFKPSVAFHIETSNLFCSAKQMIDFYLADKRNNWLIWGKRPKSLCHSQN